MNRAVLGIDAAWTPHEPSGVALVAEHPDGWTALAVAPSYATFLALASAQPVDWSVRQRGDAPNPSDLVDACRSLLGSDASLSVVAVDMPLSRVEIVGRRRADNEVSHAFGEQGCGTHTPSPARPGPISTSLHDGFRQAGFPLSTVAGALPALIEVYPHPALLTLMKETYRFKYKLSKRAALWPKAAPQVRLVNVVSAFGGIVAALSREVRLERCAIPLPGLNDRLRPSRLKAFEDSIDALVSAWIGITYLDCAGRMYGDENAAIWVP